MEFLTLLAAFPTAPGEILEFGGYEGRITIALANGARFADTSSFDDQLNSLRIATWKPLDPHSRVTTVDFRSSERLRKNLKLWGVRERVSITQGDSRRVARDWHRPVRLLVHDGASDSATISWELKKLRPHLSNGSIVAVPGLFSESSDKVDCFVRNLLEDSEACACGVVGSTGWVQFSNEPNRQQQSATNRHQLINGLSSLTQFHKRMPFLNWRERVTYLWRQSFVPRRRPSPQEWIKQVA